MNTRKLGFGMLRLPVVDGDYQKVDFEKLCPMVDAYLARGYTYFDTSFVYHGGKSEEATRKAVVERHPRESFTIATKLPVGRITSESQVSEIFEQQQKNLAVDYFDYYLLHNIKGFLYDQKIKPFRMFEFAAAKKREGKIKKLGFSIHDCAEEIDRILTEHPEVDFVQIVVNYYDWESSWVQSRKCYETIRRHGKEVIIMEPVKGGMLAHPPASLFQQMQDRAPGMSPASWALRFAAGLDGVLAVLSGMSTIEQVLENTALMESPKPLTEEERAMLIASAPQYRAMGPYHLENFDSYKGLAANGMPVDEILENYNSIQLQRSYGTTIAAENNYYTGLRYRHNISGSWLEGPVLDNEGRDITEMIQKAEKYFLG